MSVRRVYTNADVEDFFLKQERLTPKIGVRDKVTAVISSITGELPNDASLEEDEDVLVRKLERYHDVRRNLFKSEKKDSGKKNIELWRKKSCLEISYSKNGRRKKPLGFQEEIRELIEKYALKESVNKLDVLASVIEECNQTWKEDQVANVPVEKACGLLYNVNLSIRQYEEIRLALLPYNISLPTKNAVIDFKSTLYPKGIVVEKTKTSVSAAELLQSTIVDVLRVNNVKFDEDTVVHADGKSGFDGSGSHPDRNQEEATKSSGKNYLSSFWSPLRIKVGGTQLWVNPYPNSLLYARPLCVVRNKECRSVVVEHVKPVTDELNALQKTPLRVPYDNVNLEIWVETETSMLDGKMASLVLGDGGAFCHHCHTTRIEANDLAYIVQGFTITKSIEEMVETWKKIEHGELKGVDSAGRGGQCHEPLIQQAALFYGLLHQELRCHMFCLKLLYHIKANIFDWSESSKETQDAIKIAKTQVQTHIKDNCNLWVDFPTPNGGNTSTGPVAKKFFATDIRSTMCSVIDDPQMRDAYFTILGLFNQMLTVTQSCKVNKEVDPEAVRSLGIRLMQEIKQSFPWAFLTPTVHQMAAHNWELFMYSNGLPVSFYSEQPLEAWFKFLRAFKSGPACRARQSSVKDNTADVFRRMIGMTNPRIVSQRRVQNCTKCGEQGHTVRSCRLDASYVNSEEEEAISKLYV